jgi:leucine-rich repeat-containing protein 16A
MAIESKKPNQLTLTVAIFPSETAKHYTFFSLDKEDIEEINLMIIQLGTAIKTIFPQVALERVIRKIDVIPRSRLTAMKEYNEALEYRANEVCGSAYSAILDSNTLKSNISFSSSLLGPCGNFSTQYACMCDYFNLPYREEVAWDVDTIYLSHSITELSLLDFEHLETRDLIPIIAALSKNGWFKQFRASGIKLTSSSSGNKVDCEVGEQVIKLLKKSSKLEEIYLDNTGIRSDFVNKLMLALISNTCSLINTIDLSHNIVEDKGIKNLCNYLAKVTPSSTSTLSSSSTSSLSPDTSHVLSSSTLHKGLIHLNLNRCSLTSKGISELSDSLIVNKSLSSTLTTLNLSENIMKDDFNKFFNFLAQPNNIVSLDLSSTECNLDNIFGALLRGCSQKLANLNLSRNTFSSKKSHKESNVPASLKSFFSTAVALKNVNLSNSKLSSEALK